LIKFTLQSFFDEVLMESDKDKNTVIREIEDLLRERALLQNVNILIIIYIF